MATCQDYSIVDDETDLSHEQNRQVSFEEDEGESEGRNLRKIRTLTDKGKVERLRLWKNKQIAATTAVTKKRNEISRLMERGDNLHLVKMSYQHLNELFDQYTMCFDAYFAALETEELKSIESKSNTEKEHDFIKYRDHVSQWISNIEVQLADNIDSASRSSFKSTSSTRSARAKERARLAELLTEKVKFEDIRKLEEIKLDIEIAKAEARERVYAEMESPSFQTTVPPIVKPRGDHLHAQSELQHDAKDIIYPVSSSQQSTVHVQHNTPVTPCDTVTPLWYTRSATTSYHQTPVRQNFTSPYQQPPSLNPPAFSSTFTQPATESMVQAQQQMLTAMFLPQPEVPKFKGDLIEYGSFMMAFDARIVPHTNCDRDRLYYLDQQLEGEPKDLIAGCLYMSQFDGYTEARELLDKEYGDPYKVSMSYINQVLLWPDIKYDDSQKLKKFSVFLTKCLHAMKNITHMSVLNHAPNLQAIVHKLPSHLQNRWRDRVTKCHIISSRSMEFKDLVEFIDFAAKSANEPVFGKEAMQHREQLSTSSQGKTTKGRQSSSKSRSTAFATSVNSSSSTDKPRRLLSCYFCSKSHDIDDCFEFAKKTLTEKRSFMMEKKMCFGCFAYNHTVKGCLKKRLCKKCEKRHPTSLHDDNFTMKSTPQLTDTQAKQVSRSSDAVTTSCSAATSDAMETVLQSILPVTVHLEDSDVNIKTYAFLDNGSSGCFMTEDLQCQLGAPSTQTTLKLRTMHGIDIVPTSVVTGLVVMDIDCANPVPLPKTYVKNDIPVNRDQIPDPTFLKKWPYLRDMANKLPRVYPNLEVGLLIGSNCPQALEPQQVIPSGDNGPFAVLYKHGWTVNGPLHVKYDQVQNSLCCNRVIFTESTVVKECLTPDTVVKLLEKDFSEQDIGDLPGQRGYSREDKLFMDIVEQNVEFINGHYQLPLPFRIPDAYFPNNRQQALSRVKWQRKKMLASETYHRDYTVFINNLLEKGFAYPVPDDELSASADNVWYLPHHGIYHPRKPEKIRVVFDCSARYEGSSLNDRLLQGPDLTNSLIGVLTRFRTEPVAFMSDVEAMFYQVKVPVSQHDHLRFLWWPEGNLDTDFKEYRMAVHIFGAVSSPSISNFALKHTASKAEEKYGILVAETIRKNFYVDDCLKAAKDEDTAVSLVQDLVSACADGGFRLTKFTSNSRNLLKSIPTDDHSKELQSRDLDYDDLPIERALGMRWYVNSDMFGFSVELPDKPVTRRGILSTVSSLYDPLGMVSPVILPAKKILQDLCTDQSLDWDDDIPSELACEWKKWLSELDLMKTLNIPRCVKPFDFGEVTSAQLHVFSDASTRGYGCVVYLRLCDKSENIHVAFLMGSGSFVISLLLTSGSILIHMTILLMSPQGEQLQQNYSRTTSGSMGQFFSELLKWKWTKTK
ncbi:uncharacterized protein [Haliotis cracherodii]|uniref:uncharacterized protein n=1 Tax=Haliotis cracherodii TaxID=6455 RepID=UPI0039E9553A